MPSCRQKSLRETYQWVTLYRREERGGREEGEGRGGEGRGRRKRGEGRGRRKRGEGGASWTASFKEMRFVTNGCSCKCPFPSCPSFQDVVYRGFISVLDEVVLPSLSLLQCNCGIAEETWSMMKQLPYETRCVRGGGWI